ncbi:PEP-CTERM sorting domain-containing protein [Aquabacterium sp.]|uniref:PEP-CTERM sorting domain-containing protein n=1 Tax=Aquabacterium sp. TaxID=1872578 RepID=UPI002CB520CD|nr:PEP-CTERM sorting domain-containing protein [Aquabacterium sp.]HSW04466.1 PEP-CTERM sorting domain-containing protein [Aquabacterium sp.]
MRHLALSLLLAAPMLASAANLVVNGSFEADAQTPGTWSITPNITGWAGGADGVEIRNAYDGLAYDGVNFVELDTFTNSSMSQVLPTTQDQAYSLSFAYSPRAGTPAGSNGIEVLWDGQLLATLDGTGAPSGQGHQWVLHSFNVVGPDANSATLSFRAIGTSDQLGGSLDAVSVSAVPEPASAVLGLTGLGLMTWVLRQRRRADRASGARCG